VDLGLAGRTALVTGSWRGTGAAIARALAAEGARVVVHGNERGQSATVADAIRADGGRALEAWGDVRSDEGATRAAREALDTAGRIDVLVNNLGSAAGGGWLDDPASVSGDWRAMFETNVLSAARMVAHLVAPMKQRGWGRVLFIGTVGSRRPRARMPGYYAAKASLANMAVSLAAELAGSGVTANVVSPGMLATDEVRAGLARRARKEGWSGGPEELEARAAQAFLPNPAGRLGRPEEVGALVAYLCSAHAGYINGADIRIDGGSADCV